MSRFGRRFHGRRHDGDHRGPKPVRPNRPHFRKFGPRPSHGPRQNQQQLPPNQAAPAGRTQETQEVYQARGPGHLRIMGKIEYDVRTMLKVAEIPPDQAFFYLACAREMYSDYENTKPEHVEEALDNTIAKWLARDVKPDLVKRIRNRITEIYRSLKPERFGIKPPEPRKPEPEPTVENGTDPDS